MTRYVCLWFIPFFSFCAVAKNLGTVGDSWEIREQSMLSLIDERLNEFFKGKSEAEIQEEVKKRITENALRPEPTELARAEQNSERTFDPSFTVEKDIADHKGKIFARKGQVVNPFDITPFNRTLIFVNGDDEQQIEWLRAFKAETEIKKIILIKGNVKDITEKLDEEIYFDQYGGLIKRFGIQRVPTVIDQMPSQKLLRVREFAIK